MHDVDILIGSLVEDSWLTLEQVASACAVAGLCGARAAASSRGPGSFKTDFLDALYLIDPATLREQESTINAELLAVQGSPAELGGYYRPDDALASAVMRPSATLNAAIDAL